MSYRSSLCRSDTKPRNMKSVNTARCSLQNESLANKRQRRSSSLDCRARGSGSASKPRSSSEERKSGLFPGRSSNRKSSINLDVGKTFKEFRPLTDKVYIKKKMVELMEFLSESGYPHALNLAKLMQPSKKDFENIFQYLVTFIDPSLVVKKLDEDATKILKILCYPFIPNNSAFKYVARTNLPSLFGVLLFLMDILKFTDNIDESSFFYNGESEHPQENAIYLEYIFTSYFQNSDNGEDNEEEKRSVFTSIIKSRYPLNVDELRNKRDTLKQELEDLKNEEDFIKAMKDQLEKLDAEIKQYEAYFELMKGHKQKKEDTCQKKAEEVAQKESELQGLQEILAKKQAMYDAQGFDGKKELSYFENQKKELMEKLQAKKLMFRELQNDCGELEIQHRKALDKNGVVCEEFNNLYSSNADVSSNVLTPLQEIKDPQVKNLCCNFKLDFPDCMMQPSQKLNVQRCDTRKTSLEAIKKKIESTNLIFKGVLATLNQKMHEVLMKKSELAVILKVASSDEAQTEQNLSSKEKQALEDMKSVERECNDMIKKLEVMQAERLKLEEEYAAGMEELGYLQNVKIEKQKMLDDYVIEQQKLFANWVKDLEEIKQHCQHSGQEIAATVEGAVRKL